LKISTFSTRCPVVLINLELLRTFVVAAESPTFSAAARARFVTKSAVSQQMKTLEGQLGVPLFERVGRRVRVTAGGGDLAAVLRRELQVIDEALDAAASDQRGVRGLVRIGAPRPFSRLWLRPRLARLLGEHAGLRAHVSFGSPSDLEKRLVASELELAILVRKPRSTLLEARPIFLETFEAYASKAYLRAHGVPTSAGAFAAHRFIAFDEDLPMQSDWWRACFGAAPARGEVVCHVASLEEMLALAEAGVGIAVLPTYFVAAAAGASALVPIRPKGRRPRAGNQIFLAWRRQVVPTARFTTSRAALLATGDGPAPRRS
jgi:DNA-binding transcriptional LysR family regulator